MFLKQQKGKSPKEIELRKRKAISRQFLSLLEKHYGPEWSNFPELEIIDYPSFERILPVPDLSDSEYYDEKTTETLLLALKMYFHNENYFINLIARSC